MKKPSFASLAALLIALAVLIQPALAVNEGIVDDGEPPRFPNVGTFLVVSQFGEPIEPPIQLVSGTLVAPRVFLTAGHGTAEAEAVIAAGLFELGDARISFAADPMDPATWLELEAVGTHPGYRGDLGFGEVSENDIGLVVLKEPVEGIEPVTLAPVGFLDQLRRSGVLREAEAVVTIVGYGRQRVFPPPADVADSNLRRFAEVVFGGFTKKWLNLLQNPVAHGGGANQGDSGGPAFWTDPATGTFVQVGAASVVNDVAWNHYTRIDVPEILDFINAVIDQVEDADAR